MKYKSASFPWTVDRDGDGELALWDADGNNLLHSESQLPCEVREASAHLAVKAPTILKDLLRLLDGGVFSEDYFVFGRILRIRRLISEATPLILGMKDPETKPQTLVVLHFQADESEENLEAEGPTLLAALAALEREVMEHYGPEAEFCADELFREDGREVLKYLAQSGTSYRRTDFSEPERSYTITRLQ